MIIGVLKCDSVSEQLEGVYGKYPDMFARFLLPVDASLQFITFDAENGELPDDIHAADAYIITGSRHGVYDGHAWIVGLEQFIQKCYLAKKKIIGVCFGHQLIAQALGGKVIKSPKGWGLGMSHNTVLLQKEWMQPFQNQLNVFVSHQDQVVELPEGAEVLATSDFCPNYMTQTGSSLLTIQGHPEFTKAYYRDFLSEDEGTVDVEHFKKAMHSLEQPVDNDVIAQWMVNFLRG